MEISIAAARMVFSLYLSRQQSFVRFRNDGCEAMCGKDGLSRSNGGCSSGKDIAKQWWIAMVDFAHGRTVQSFVGETIVRSKDGCKARSDREAMVDASGRLKDGSKARSDRKARVDFAEGTTVQSFVGATIVCSSGRSKDGCKAWSDRKAMVAAVYFGRSKERSQSNGCGGGFRSSKERSFVCPVVRRMVANGGGMLFEK